MQVHEITIAQLEAEADVWAYEVNLMASIEQVAHISRLSLRVPESVRDGMVNRQKQLMDALMRQAFIEGAVRACDVIEAQSKEPKA